MDPCSCQALSSRARQASRREATSEQYHSPFFFYFFFYLGLRRLTRGLRVAYRAVEFGNEKKLCERPTPSAGGGGAEPLP